MNEKFENIFNTPDLSEHVFVYFATYFLIAVFMLGFSAIIICLGTMLLELLHSVLNLERVRQEPFMP